MTFPEFDKFFDEFVEECRKMRDTKGKEYANGEDRFKNFTDAASELGATPLQIGMIFADKHIRSVKSYIRTGKVHSEERIRGRFIDIVTYMILMAGIAEEIAPHIIEAPVCFITEGEKVEYIGKNTECIPTNSLVHVRTTIRYPKIDVQLMDGNIVTVSAYDLQKCP